MDGKERQHAELVFRIEFIDGSVVYRDMVSR
jgi:hypothetical protein